jgi:TRAP-type mannitol/chloroaromatic compound transport system permease small subunit
MLRLAHAIDRFTERSAVLIAWLLVPLIAVVMWEVAARYAFNRPTSWAYETIYMLCASMFMLGAAYALRAGAHIRTDFLWEKWSPRTQAAIEVVGYGAFFLPGMALFFLSGAEATWHALITDERSADTAWFPPLWPLKALVPLSALLLLVQGVAELLKSLAAWRSAR